MHHGHFWASAKALFLSLINIEGVTPYAFEIEGIQKVTVIVRPVCFFIEHFGNHTHRVIAGPLVDHVHRLAIIEVTVLGLGVVEFVGLADKSILQANA